MKCFNHTCQGESHKAVNKVCQDYSFSHIYDDGTAMAIVCDGHGGNRYFRSDVGSRFATEIIEQNVRLFLVQSDLEVFRGKPYTRQTAIQTEVTESNFEKRDALYPVFRQLFASILSRWHEAILCHAEENPLSEAEQNSVEEKYQQEFLRRDSLEKIYGCTLMCYVYTPTFWFAFHLGDGKCIMFDNEGHAFEPIPWDERCFLNKTTSICDSDAINEFRYCYCGDGTFPLAVFLGSDGIDDSFGNDVNLTNFYIQILKNLSREGLESVKQEFIDELPILSKRGSQDDMSVAFVYNDHGLLGLIEKLIQWQINSARNEYDIVVEKISTQWDRISKLESKYWLSQKEKIDLEYAQTELDRNFATKDRLLKKINLLIGELGNPQNLSAKDTVGKYPKCLKCSLNGRCNMN